MNQSNYSMPGPNRAGSNTWMWIALSLALLCSLSFIALAGVIAYFWFNSTGDGRLEKDLIAKQEVASSAPTNGNEANNQPKSNATPRVSNTASDSVTPPLAYRWEPSEIYVWDFNIGVINGISRTDHSGKASFSASLEKQSISADKKPAGSGTGFVVDESGLIVTCAHVVDRATAVRVRLGDKSYPAEVVATDQVLDLALLKIEANGLKPLPLASADAPEIGQEVRSVGFPLKDVLGDSVKVTRGMLSGKVQLEGRELFQIDAPINPGNSGGPIIDAIGNVVGVASEKMHGQGISNIGFCIPSSVLANFLKKRNVVVSTKANAPGTDVSLARSVIPSVSLIEVDLGAAEYYDLIDYSEFNSFSDPFSRLPSMRDRFDRGRLNIAPDGTILECEGALEAPSLLGPVIALPLIPLPRPWQTTWGSETEAELNLVVGESFRDPLQGLLPRPFYRNRFGLRPDYEVKTLPVTFIDRLNITKRTGDKITISRECTLASNSELKFEHRVNWIYEFDTAQALVVKAEGDGVLKIDGKKISTIEIQLTYRPAPKVAANTGSSSPPPSPAPNSLKEPEKPRDEMPEKLKKALEVLAKSDAVPSDLVSQLNELASMQWNAKFRKEVVSQIAVQLKRKEESVILAALKALNQWDAATCVEEVVPFLKHTSGDIRTAAVEYLGAMQDGSAAPALCDALEHEELREKIYAALKSIGPTGELGVIKMLSHPEEVVRIQGCLILEEIGSAKSATELKRLASGDGKDSQQAKKTLAKLGIENEPEAPSSPTQNDDVNPFEPKKPKA